MGSSVGALLGAGVGGVPVGTQGEPARLTMALARAPA